jgi:ABC-type proline/glycine betaine transport system substrate-binding protein
MMKFHTAMKSRSLLFWFVLGASIQLSAGIGSAAESAKLIPLRLAYSAITVNQAIPWISLEAGHFKKHGLDVELIHASSITALQALLACEVAIVQSATDGAVTSNLSGADTIFIGAILDKPL